MDADLKDRQLMDSIPKNRATNSQIMAQSITPQTSKNGNSSISNKRRISSKFIDSCFQNITLIVALLGVLLIAGIAITLIAASRETLIDPAHHFVLFGKTWDPNPPDEAKLKGSIFGALPFLWGTLVTSGIAMLIAVPLGALSAIFLAEIAPNLSAREFIPIASTVPVIVLGVAIVKPAGLPVAIAITVIFSIVAMWFANSYLLPKWTVLDSWSKIDHSIRKFITAGTTILSFLVELLAAVPSIVYGFWALKYLVPVFAEKFEPWLAKNFGQIPFFSAPPEGSFTGQDTLCAGTVLAMMILPFVTAVSRDILKTVPVAQREAAYGMGATRWEAISQVVLRYASGGIIGAVLLGLGRAIGETMAVTLVIGNAQNAPTWGDSASFSFMRAADSLSSILANQYPNPNTSLHSSALTQIALLLFVVTVIINGIARVLVWLTSMQMGGTTSPAVQKARQVITVGLNATIIGLVGAGFLYQTFQDLRAHGLVGLFGVAELLGFAISAIFLFNRYAAGKTFFLPWRKLGDAFASALCTSCVVLASCVIITLLAFVAHDGLPAINGQFFLPPTGDPDRPGGMLHAIFGTGMIVFFASLFGIPVGIMGGIYLSEFAGKSKIGGLARFAADLLNGVPSIVIGIFAYTIVVHTTAGIDFPKPFDFFLNRGSFGTAASFALGIMMIPTVMRTTEELLRLVPMALREGALGLGATRAWTTWSIVLLSARNGIITGALLAIARIAGETAPLIMVSCSSNLMPTLMSKRTASLPIQIFELRDLPGQLALSQSWGVALILVTMVLTFSILARVATRSKMRTN